ncbi:beta-N-acetylhexosaminidase [Roseiterribacter gracilis]|uniref:beta-N-acetylhexosaminidase n=1 Tax=Roseiterribacter gracilis TaxID=2812848 RepID=A0A8S8X6J4_9PROT|nr:glycosyl hydrolase [Rhodospirillales bacterium TMPK1]
MLGCAGPLLGDSERDFFRDANPLGFILFKRNVDTPGQVRALVDALRAAVGREAPVLIDQEGGRVARLGPPQWPALPAARRIGELAERDLAAGREAARLHAQLIGQMLAELGLTSACAPVLDLLRPETHTVIGDRAYGGDPALVAALADAAIDGFLDAGVLPIAKHIPGHGRATSDSHLELPVVTASEDALRDSDFIAFRGVRSAWAMVAHVVYQSIDALPASISARIIGDVIRRDIGFDGVLIADDIGMKALSGSFAARAEATLAAGCDLTLHCSGVMDEMVDAMRGTRAIDDVGLRRVAKPWRRPVAKVRAERARLDELLRLSEAA